MGTSQVQVEGLLCTMPASEYCEKMSHIYTKTSVSIICTCMYMHDVRTYVCIMHSGMG